MKTITLGILGGGQLGRMSALAAAELGIRTIIFTDEKNSPASKVSSYTIVSNYDNKKQLKKFASLVDVISYEFENIPIITVRYLKKLKPVYPDQKLLEVSQDRINEKTYLNKIGIPTTRWAAVKNQKQIESFLIENNLTGCILKTTRNGYDGKGQVKITGPEQIKTALEKLGAKNLIAEEIIPFKCEISVIVARDKFGKTVTYGPMLNVHKNHILHTTTYPARGISKAVSNRAVAKAKKLAQKVNLRGVLALEMFVTRDGRVLANEIAPRTHNSGHWTIDACGVSQFEQHVRAVCGLPLGAPDAHSAATMTNLIGDDLKKAPKYLRQKNACVHLYGKDEIKPGRKMGHVTVLE